jgi:surfactin synthase thioesterase subunit
LAGVDVIGFQLPGRQERLREKPVEDLRAVVPDVVATIVAELDGRPFGLFGHSMGTILAYEVAQGLAAAGAPAPALLAVSGRRAPDSIDPGFVPYHPLSDDALLARVGALGGIPPEVARHPDLLELMLPTLRADFTAVETFRFTHRAPLTCPIAVFGGVDDPDSPPASLSSWTGLSTAATSVFTYDGGHFFLWDHRAHIASVITAALRA